VISLKNVHRAYSSGTGTVTVLRNISLEIAAGEMVAVVGTSGSGKATLMNIIGCLDVASQGEILINGQNTAHLTADALAKLRRQHIGFIFQRYHLMPDISALGNVEIPAIYANVSKSDRRERALALLSRLGLGGHENNLPGQLSGGQQQRVSIGRALVNGGEIILADEPTGALDSVSGEQVLQILDELHQQGHTVIIVTHDAKVAERAQRIITLSDGEIITDSGNKITSLPTLVKKTGPSQSCWKSRLDRAQDAFFMALKSMNAHRLRTILTMTGIVFGIAAVVTVAALGEGAKQKTLREIENLGTNVVSIYPDNDVNANIPLANPTLDIADVNTLVGQTYVDGISPQVFANMQVLFGKKSASVRVTGVGKDFFRIHGVKILQGSLFAHDDSAIQEAVINENTRKLLFSENNISPLGKIINLGPVPVRVIGVAESYAFSSPDSLSVWVPYTTMLYRMSASKTLTSISLKLKDAADNISAVKDIKRLLIQRHGQKDFIIFNQDRYRKSYDRTSIIFNLLTLMVAAISLMIGSLGVMNIMLVSVTERTHEIGVRMAVGARRSDILQQFMIEAVLVCLTGGALGIAVSLAVSPLFSLLPGNRLTAIFSWQIAVIAFACSTLIGLIFGYLPASKAAKMDPVVSLASE